MKIIVGEVMRFFKRHERIAMTAFVTVLLGISGILHSFGVDILQWVIAPAQEVPHWMWIINVFFIAVGLFFIGLIIFLVGFFLGDLYEQVLTFIRVEKKYWKDRENKEETKVESHE